MKTCLITGASYGLGVATVKYLISKKQRVIAIVNDTQRFGPTLLANPLLDTIVLDSTDESQVAQMPEYITAKYGKVDILINYAVITLDMIQHLLPLIRKDGQGHIIDLTLPSRLDSLQCSTDLVNRCAGGLSKIFYQEAFDRGIKVSIIEPNSPTSHFSDN